MKKKILIIPSWVPTKKSPNSGRIIFSQFNDLVEAGVNVNLAYVSDIFTPHILNKEFLVYERQIYRKKILFSYKRFKITRCIWINKYFRIIEEIGVDNIGLIHAHSYIAGYVASRIKNKYGIRYIVTERSPDFFTNNIHKSFKSSIYNIYEDAEFVLCVSNILRHKFKALFNNECKVFPNYVNVIQDVFKRKFDLFTIIMVCDNEKIKNTKFALNVFKQYTYKNPDDRIIVIGNGYEQSQINNTQFLSQLPHSKVIELISQSHLLVSFSEYETFGMTILESLFNNTVVLCTDSGGPIDFVEDDYIIKENDLDLNKVIDRIAKIKANYKNINPGAKHLGLIRDRILPQLIELYKEYV